MNEYMAAWLIGACITYPLFLAVLIKPKHKLPPNRTVVRAWLILVITSLLWSLAWPLVVLNAGFWLFRRGIEAAGTRRR